MATFFLVLALLACGASVGIQGVQKRTDQQYVPDSTLFLLFAGGIVSAILGTLIWMFTADLPGGLSAPIGGVGLGVLLLCLWHMRDGLPRITRDADDDATPEGPAPRGAANPRPVPEEEPDPFDVDDPRDTRNARVFVVGDDPQPTAKTRPKRANS